MPDRTRSWWLDLTFYLVSALFAGATAIWSEFYDYRVWGNFATVGYLLAFGLTLWPGRSRWLPVGAAGLLAVLVPTLVLVFRRSPDFVWGRWPWAFPAQPEVWVVERSARLLIHTGTPYPDLAALGRAPVPDDYTPYGPVMTVFGLPRALLGNGAPTDARIAFLLGTALVVLLTLRLLGWPRVPVAAAQLAVISPLTAFTAAVAGDDLPVVAVIVLATVLVYRADPVWAGVAGALVVNMKLTALPAIGVLAVAVFARRGGRALARYLIAAAGTSVVVVVPVLLAGPGQFVEQVIKYPAGLGQAKSPAASPLPGHLIASAGPLGHAISIVLLGIGACAIAAWLVLRPPRTATDTMARIAIGLGAAIMLAPATRWGYLVYPLAMLGAMIAVSPIAPNLPTAETHARGGTPVGPTESAVNPDTH